MARTLAILTMAVTGIATTYAGSIGINPGDQLLPNGSVVSIGLLPGVSPTYSFSGAGASNLSSGNTDGITINTGLSSVVGQGAYGATGKGFTQNNLGIIAQLGKPTIGASTNTNSGSLGTGMPDRTGSGTPCSSVGCQTVIYTPPVAPVFDLLGDGNSTGTANVWTSQSTGATSTTDAQITIPIGIFGVQSVSTILNALGGVTTAGAVCANGAAIGTNSCTAANGAFSTISFQFNATDPTGQSGTNLYETFALINGVTQRNILDGAQAGGTFASSLCGGSNLLSTSSSTASCSYATTDSNGNAYNVQVGNLWNGVVSANGGSTNTLGDTMVLDYQIFPVLSAYQHDYLVSAQVTDYGSGVSNNHEVLAGISVTTPEPSTIAMVFGGFLVMGISRFKRRNS